MNFKTPFIITRNLKIAILELRSQILKKKIQKKIIKIKQAIQLLKIKQKLKKIINKKVKQ